MNPMSMFGLFIFTVICVLAAITFVTDFIVDQFEISDVGGMFIFGSLVALSITFAGFFLY